MISPLLANLFLHHAFDMWMARQFPHVPFERYADDAICHCPSEAEARGRSTVRSPIGNGRRNDSHTDRRASPQRNVDPGQKETNTPVRAARRTKVRHPICRHQSRLSNLPCRKCEPCRYVLDSGHAQRTINYHM